MRIRLENGALGFEKGKMGAGVDGKMWPRRIWGTKKVWIMESVGGLEAVGVGGEWGWSVKTRVGPRCLGGIIRREGENQFCSPQE